MLNIAVLLAGVRGFLFMAAFCSAVIFLLQSRDAWQIISAVYLGKVRQGHLIALGSFGWFIGALSSLSLTAHWLYNQLVTGRVQTFSANADLLWSVISLTGFGIGFYVPLLAMLWYKERLGLALFLGIWDVLVGLGFAWGAAHSIH